MQTATGPQLGFQLPGDEVLRVTRYHTITQKDQEIRKDAEPRYSLYERTSTRRIGFDQAWQCCLLRSLRAGLRLLHGILVQVRVSDVTRILHISPWSPHGIKYVYAATWPQQCAVTAVLRVHSVHDRP